MIAPDEWDETQEDVRVEDDFEEDPMDEIVRENTRNLI